MDITDNLGKSIMMDENRDFRQHERQNSDSPLRGGLRSNAPYKIREFEWFEVETKIRLFVQKLIEPTLRQIYDDRAVVDRVETAIRNNDDQVSMLYNIVLKQGAGIPIFQEFDRRLSEQEVSFETERRRMAQENNRIQQEIEKIGFRSKQLIEQSRQMENAKTLIMEEFTEMQRHNKDFRNDVTQNIANLSNELTTNFSWARSEIQKSEDRFTELDQTLVEYQTLILRDEKRINELKQQSTDFINKLYGQNTRFENIDIHVLQIQDQLQLTRKLQSSVIVLQNSLHTLDNFISTYQPLYIQGQISETLYNCFQQSLASKLALYESKRFDELHKNILADEGQGRVSKKILEYSQVLETVTKRNQKHLQQAKLNLMKGMINDNNADKSEEILKAQEEEHFDKITEKEKIDKSKSQTPLLEMQQYQEVLAKVSSTLQTQNTSFQNKLEQSVKDAHKNIRELDEQLLIMNMHIQEDADKRLHLIGQQMSSLKESLNSALDNIGDLSEQMTDLIMRQNKMDLIMHTILRFLSLILHIQIQDEIDRQGIALLGLKEPSIDDLPNINNNGKVKMIVHLKPECLSCSSSPLNTLTAFKMACLGYNPSDISVDGKMFKRDTMLEMCSKVLQAARKEMADVPGHVEMNMSSRLQNSSVDSQVPQPKIEVIRARKPQIQASLFPQTSSPISTNQTKVFMNPKHAIKANGFERQYQRAHRAQQRLKGLNKTLWNVNEQI